MQEIGGIPAFLINLGTRWESLVITTLWLLYSRGKSPWYPLNGRMGMAQSQFSCFGEEINFYNIFKTES
jgi:hypothetical protein